MAKTKRNKKLSKSSNEDEDIAESSCKPKSEKDVPKRKASKEALEKKREKNRLNKLKKRQMKRGEIEISTKGKEEALEYLKCWSTDKANWKFMKVRQTWLLKHMFKTTFTDEEFDTLVEYATSIQGNARIKLREQAESVIKDIDEKWTKYDADVQIHTRAQNVVELL
uniref:WKF domain-containing protein n=1 Tax=Strigamia maritima TaxID=126957 RepID=T1IT15_STRMM